MPWRPDILQHGFAFERASVTPYTVTTTFLPALFSCYTMAVLVQLPRTGLYRAALLPVVYWLAFRASVSLDLSWDNPSYAQFNEGLALTMFTIAMRSTVWVFAKKTYTRLPICKLGNGTIGGYDENDPIEHDIPLSVAMWNAWDLIVNLRGIGWIGPEKMHIPTPHFRVESRFAFFFLSVFRAIFFVATFDIIALCVCSLGPDTFGTPTGGTILDPSLPPLKRYTKSSIITLLSSVAAYTVIETIYQVHAALFTLVFQQYPSQWPPLFDSPWLSTSLTSFWGRRWQQLFREYFVVVGSKPMQKYLGRVGTVLGGFALSGILHDVGMRGMSRGADTLEVVGFFLLQGVGVIVEHSWKKATGRRVGGVIGFFWVFSFFLVTGHIFVDVWARRGLLGSDFIPKAYRPSTLFNIWTSRRSMS